MLLTALVCSILLIHSVTGCYLNTCPYRRYGRNVRCAKCGPNGEGVCATDGVCCTSKACVSSLSCVGSSACSPRSCEVGASAGFCVSPVMCCSQEFCQQNMKCLIGSAPGSML
uniref:Uncharacterized protein n=1 Tax=Panagrolaimus superbus TaxID=310955 RepID=A0A914Y0L7_9BILA